MGLSRKRRKELRRLKGAAEELWRDQQELLSRAGTLSKEARRQAGHYTREEVTPRVRAQYEARVAPRVERGGSALRSFGDTVTSRLVPAVGTVIGTAMSVSDIAKDARVKVAARAQQKRVPEKKSGVGGVIGLTLGVAAVAGLGYVVWQTFRADDELWVADEEPPAPVDPAS